MTIINTIRIIDKAVCKNIRESLHLNLKANHTINVTSLITSNFS
jgi:hypothetical protein